MLRVMSDERVDWEELARREPYFAVLATDGSDAVQSSAEPSEAYSRTGEADVAALLNAIETLLSRKLALTSVLDFGCGAGRLTLPLARRATQVTACDIAPTMLAHVRRNAGAAGLSNVSLISPDELQTSQRRFDFVCSLLVLQYLPHAEGYAAVRTLTEALARGGVAALEIPLAPALTVERYVRAMRTRSRFTPASAAGERQTPRRALRMYRYGQRRLAQEIETAGGHVVALLPAHEGEQNSVVVVIEKR